MAKSEAPKISPWGIFFRFIGGIFRWTLAGLTAWYRDGELLASNERAARWTMRDRLERYWSVTFYALLLLWGSSNDLALPWVEDPFWARALGVVTLTIGGVFVSIITARRIVVAVTHDPWTAREMWTDKLHLAAIAIVGMTTPVAMFDRSLPIPSEWVTAGLPLLTGIICGAWAASVILVDHRSKTKLLGVVKTAFSGSESEWSRARFVARGKIVTIRHAPAAAFADRRASEAKLAAVAPGWQVDEGRTSAEGSRLTLVTTTDETEANRAIVKASEGLVISASTLEMDAGKRPRKVRYNLAPGTGASAYLRVDALAQQDGLRVTDWQWSSGYAIASRLDSATAAMRDAVAAYLKVQPYEVELRALTDEDERVTSVIVSRFPKTDTDATKRTDTWRAILEAESVREEHEVWLLDEAVGSTMVWNLRLDPLATIQPYPWDIEPTMTSIPFAVDDHGAPLSLRLYESNALVGGIPGAGKSAGATAIISGVARLANTALYGIDLKLVELPLWQPRFEEITTGFEESRDLLIRLFEEMRTRYVWLAENRLKKFSPETFTPERPLIVLVIDELAELVGADDYEKAAVDEVKGKLRRLVALGRAAGVVVITMTQKPESTIVPTNLRDNLAQRVAFATTTPDATDTILGKGMATKGADSHLIPQSLKGVCFMTTEDSREPRRARAYWIPDQEVEGIAERTAHLRVGVTLSKLDDDAMRTTDFSDEELEKLMPAPIILDDDIDFDAPLPPEVEFNLDDLVTE